MSNTDSETSLSSQPQHSQSFSSDSARELEVFGHDGDSFCMNCTKIGVFKNTYYVCFSSFLEGKNSRCLKAELILIFSSNFSNKSLERKFSDEEVCALLKFANFTKSNSPRSKAVTLFSIFLSGSMLLSLILRDVLPRSFASGVLACCLLGASHFLKI
jgi:hypothetical protein